MTLFQIGEGPYNALSIEVCDPLIRRLASVDDPASVLPELVDGNFALPIFEADGRQLLTQIVLHEGVPLDFAVRAPDGSPYSVVDGMVVGSQGMYIFDITGMSIEEVAGLLDLFHTDHDAAARFFYTGEAFAVDGATRTRTSPQHLAPPAPSPWVA